MNPRFTRLRLRLVPLLLLSLHPLFVATSRSESIPVPGVPSLAFERAETFNCYNQLHGIVFAARTWQSENGGEWPSGFSVLTNQLGTPAALFCPSHYRREPVSTNWNDFDWDSIDYTWITPSNLSDPSAVFCQCKIHRNVGRTGGFVDVIFGFQPGWPRILAPPMGYSASTGSLVRLEFVLTNAALPVHFQWNREDPYWRTNVYFEVTDYDTGEGYWRTNFVGTNTPIPGATNAIYEIASAVTNDAGFYSVTISNSLGTAKTSQHRLSVPIPPTRIPYADVMCINRLKMIYLAARLWATDHADSMPLHFGEMTNDIGYPLFGWPTMLYCQSDTNRLAPASWAAVNFTNTSYEIVQTNAPLVCDDPPCLNYPFAWCRVHGFVIYGDGGIEPASSFISGVVVSTNGQFSLVVRNSASRSFEIQASTNLVDWENLLTATNPMGSVFFTDPTTNSRHRFYRTRLIDRGN